MNTVAQYIDTWSLLDLYEAVDRTPGVRMGMRWWEQADIDLTRSRELAAATTGADKEKWRNGGGGGEVRLPGRGTNKEYNVADLTNKGQSILSLCTIYRVWNTTALLYAHHQYTETGQHRWNLPVLCYHKIMVIYPYPFLVVITQFLSCIIFINDCICILNGSPR